MLVWCPECDERISSEATHCPNCGYPIIGRKQQLENSARIREIEEMSFGWDGR